MTLAYVACVLVGLLSVVGVDVGVGGFLVDLAFFRVWSIWPMAVASDGGRYFFTLSMVSMGHVVKCPFLMAARKVDVAGL